MRTEARAPNSGFVSGGWFFRIKEILGSIDCCQFATEVEESFQDAVAGLLEAGGGHAAEGEDVGLPVEGADSAGEDIGGVEVVFGIFEFVGSAPLVGIEGSVVVDGAGLDDVEAPEFEVVYAEFADEVEFVGGPRGEFGDAAIEGFLEGDGVLEGEEGGMSGAGRKFRISAVFPRVTSGAGFAVRSDGAARPRPIDTSLFGTSRHNNSPENPYHAKMEFDPGWGGASPRCGFE